MIAYIAVMDSAFAGTNDSRNLNSFMACPGVDKFHPAERIKALIDNSVINGHFLARLDGVPLFAVKGNRYFFGMRVLAVQGFDAENEDSNPGYERAPGTENPTFVSVYVEATENEVKSKLGNQQSSFDISASTDLKKYLPQENTHAVTEVICFADD